MIKTLLIFFIALSIVSSVQLYKKVVHTTDPNALCLDGTPPVLYYHEGSQKNKFLVFFIGGGLCSGLTLQQTIADCHARSKTQLGSSKFWPETVEGEGYLSTDPAANDMANWTKILIGYCDGSLHQGYRQTPISYKGDKMYFRGAANTRSHFKWIMQRYPNFKSASQIIITGSSAGGIATYLWTNYVTTLVNNPSTVLSIPDSGIFLITKTFSTNFDLLQTVTVNLFKLANIDQKTPLDLCNGRYKNEQYKCLYIQYAWTSLQTRTLLINSEYDSWMINNAMQIKCLKKGVSQQTLSGCSQEQKNFIEQYRTKFKSFMELFLMKSTNSAWTIGCSSHGYSFEKKYFDTETERVPTKTGLTIRQAINAFVFEDQRVHASEQNPWPSNSGCAY